MSPVEPIRRLWYHMITNRVLTIYTAIVVSITLVLVVGDLYLW